MNIYFKREESKTKLFKKKKKEKTSIITYFLNLFFHMLWNHHLKPQTLDDITPDLGRVLSSINTRPDTLLLVVVNNRFGLLMVRV